MSTYWSTLTDFGTSSVTTAIANNSKINIAKVVLGDGVLTDVATEKSRTAIKNKVWETTTAPSVTVNPNDANQIMVETTIPSSAGGWTVREVGLLDSNNKLIAIAKVADFDKPTSSQGQSTEYAIKMIVAVSNTSAVTLTVDASVITATQDFVNTKLAKKANKDFGVTFIATTNYNQNNITATVNTSTLLPYNNKIADTSNSFDLNTGRFKPKVAGYYNITVNAYLTRTSGASNIKYTLGIRKNGTDVTHINSGTEYMQQSFNCLVYLNGTTDYVDTAFSVSKSHAYIGTRRISGFLVKAD